MKNKSIKTLEPNEVTKNNLKIMYLSLGVLQIFKLILWFVDTMYESYEFLIEHKEEYSMCTLWSEDAPGLTVAVVILSVISIAMCVLPIIRNNPEKRIFPIVTLIILLVSCVAFAIFYISLISAVSSHSSMMSVANQKIGLTFWGYLQLISLIISVIITFVISSKTKAISNWKKQNAIVD